jgi:hypothetical protein
MTIFGRSRWLPTLAGLAVLSLLAIAQAACSQRAPAAGRPPTTRAAHGTVWLATTGNDAGCRRNDQTRPCATFGKSFQLAHGGDTVIVQAGRYPTTNESSGATDIGPPGKKQAPVTFRCAGGGDVTFAAAEFAFLPGVSGVAFQGGCFRFHVVDFGYGGYTGVTSNIELDGVHMESFNCPGCRNVTIRNSEIGPLVACYMPGDGYGVPSYGNCDASDPNQAYWAAQGGTSGPQQEPFIHSGGAGRAINFTLDHDRIHGISSRWSGTHTGGLLIWDTDGLTIENTTFDHDAIYDIEFNSCSNDIDVVLRNNVFGWPVYSFDPTEPRPGKELPTGFRELGIGVGGAAQCGGTTPIERNWTIEFNRIAHGFITDGIPGTTYDNVVIRGNVLGSQTTCGQNGVPVGVTFDSNVFVGRHSCGTHALRVSRSPYVDAASGDFQLRPRSAAACFVANVRAGRKPTTLCGKRPANVNAR